VEQVVIGNPVPVEVGPDLVVTIGRLPDEVTAVRGERGASVVPQEVGKIPPVVSDVEIGIAVPS
jgi:hypothetical protein